MKLKENINSISIDNTNDINLIKEDFLNKIDKEGMCLIKNILPLELVQKLKNELLDAINEECKFHNSSQFVDYGMVLLCSKYKNELLNIFNLDKIFKPFEWVLGKDCITYSNASSSMPPNKTNYSGRIHIDSPIDYPNNYMLRLLSLIILDDFTEENGSTWFLPKSHNLTIPPSEEYFYNNANRLIAPAGSILYWNPKIFHAGGNNNTDKWRHAFTIVMTRYFCKQRLDIPNILGDIKVSDNAKRRLGYLNQPPKNYKEYYERK